MNQKSVAAVLWETRIQTEALPPYVEQEELRTAQSGLEKKRFQPQITARESQYLLLQHCQRGVMCTVISQLFMYTLNGFADRVKGR